MLETFLDFYRDIVTSKVEGVSDADARRSLVPSQSTLSSIIKHLRWVEVGWFHQVLGARFGTHKRSRGHEWEFDVGPEEPIQQLVAEYQDACAESRAIAGEYELSDTVPHGDLEQVSVRWLYLHMIEETARHAGHLDIIREQVDGRTGFT